MHSIKNSIKVAWFLSIKRLKGGGFLSNALIVLVMTLTFLNLLVVRGILIGLPAGVVNSNEKRYFSDIYISVPSDKKHIDRYEDIQKVIRKTEGIKASTTRYISSAFIEADYDKRLKKDETPNSISVRALGIDTKTEDKVVRLSDALVEGRFFDNRSQDEIVLGKDIVSKFEAGEAFGNLTLDNVDLGTEVKVTINDVTKKLTVVGFIGAKVNELDSRVLMSQTLMKDFIDRENYKPDEIVIKVGENYSPQKVQLALLELGVQNYADIETAEEYQPSFVEDIIVTFALLGDMIGSISLVVASITVFIIIFVNAITQRKQIGILKGIGISAIAIEISYVIQAVFYVLIGAFISIPLLYFVLVPFFDANPIDFPFSDGIIVAEYSATAVRTALMFVTTAIAGYLPARYIVKKNTLDSILGR